MGKREGYEFPSQGVGGGRLSHGSGKRIITHKKEGFF